MVEGEMVGTIHRVGTVGGVPLQPIHMQPGYDDWELSIEGCPEQPSFYFIAKPGRCMSGWFKIIPYNPD
jgi:hypothetical protein